MPTQPVVNLRPAPSQRAAEIEAHLGSIIQRANLTTSEIVRLAALALAESEHDLLAARRSADRLHRLLLRERSKSVRTAGF